MSLVGSVIAEQIRMHFTDDVTPAGSRITCDPAPMDTDEDWLVVCPDSEEVVAKVTSYLAEEGFEWEGDTQHYQQVCANGFMSWRNGHLNFIITKNADFGKRHKAATEICRRLNLMMKDQRIMLFQAVLYGNIWGDNLPMGDRT